MSSALIEVRKEIFSPTNTKHRDAINNCAELLRYRLRSLQRHDEYFVRTGFVFLALYAMPIIPWSMTLLIGLTAWLTKAYHDRMAQYKDYLDIRQEALATYDWVAADAKQREAADALEPFKKLTVILAEITNPDRIIQPKDFVPESTLLGKLGSGMLSLVGWQATTAELPAKETPTETEVEHFPFAVQVFQYNPDKPHPAYQRVASFAQEKVSGLVKKFGGGVEQLPATLFSVAAAQLEAPKPVEKPKLS